MAIRHPYVWSWSIDMLLIKMKTWTSRTEIRNHIHQHKMDWSRLMKSRAKHSELNAIAYASILFLSFISLTWIAQKFLTRWIFIHDFDDYDSRGRWIIYDSHFQSTQNPRKISLLRCLWMNRGGCEKKSFIFWLERWPSMLICPSTYSCARWLLAYIGHIPPLLYIYIICTMYISAFQWAFFLDFSPISIFACPWFCEEKSIGIYI